MILLQWRRTRDKNTNLELWVNEQDRWVDYKQSKHYVPDYAQSTMSGFHTAQAYLKLGATYLPITPEDYKVPEEE